jgi:hypothetical protein
VVGTPGVLRNSSVTFRGKLRIGALGVFFCAGPQIRHSPFAIRHSPFGISPVAVPQFAVRHSQFDIPRFSCGFAPRF